MMGDENPSTENHTPWQTSILTTQVVGNCQLQFPHLPVSGLPLQVKSVTLVGEAEDNSQAD